MRYAIFAALAVALLFASEWLYRTLLRPIDPVTPEMASLAKHFSAAGVSVSPYAVRHGFIHSKVRAVSALRIEGFPLPVLVTQTPSELEAVAQLARAVAQSAGLPPFLQPARRGTLIMTLSFWGDDTESMARKVQDAFASFNQEI